MAKNTGGDGQGHTQNTSVEEHLRRRREAKRRKARHGRGGGGPRATFTESRLEDREIRIENEQIRIEQGLRDARILALSALNEYANHKFADTDDPTKTKRRYGKNDLQAMSALVELLFERNENTIADAEANPAKGRLMRTAQKFFVFGSEICGLRKQYRGKEGYEWYSNFEQNALMSREVAYRRYLRATTQVA